MTPTFVDIVHRWAFEHYPVEILERVEFMLVVDDNGIPKELILDSRLPAGSLTTMSHEQLKEMLAKDIHRIHFNIASPTLFQDLEAVLFRIWGLRACKRPFRTHDRCGCEDVQS